MNARAGSCRDTAATVAHLLAVPIVSLLVVAATFAFTSAPSAGAAGDLDIVDFAFAPVQFTVPSGQEFTVSNRDGAIHTVTADDASFDTGDIDGGAKARLTIATPGRYTYFCRIHDYMTGVIDVE